MGDNPNPQPRFPVWSVNLLSRFHRYRTLMKRFWWLLLLTISGAVSFQAYQVSTEPPSYASTARIMISNRISLPESTVNTNEIGNPMETQMALIRSTQVREMAINALRAQDPGLKDESIPEKVEVHQSGLTPILDLRTVGKDPKVARDFLQATINSYISFQNDIRADPSDNMIHLITDQLSKLETTIQADEDEMLQFQKANNIVFLQEQGSSAGNHLAELNNQLVARRNEYDLLVKLTEKQGELKGLPIVSGEGDGGTNAADQGRLRLASATDEFFRAQQQAEQRIVVLRDQVKEAEQYLKPAHPKLVALRAQIADLEHSIALSKAQNIEEANIRRETLGLEIQHLEAMIKEYEPIALNLSYKLAEFDRLRSKVKRDEELQESLLQKMQSIDLNKRFDEQRFKVMDPATDGTPMKGNVQVRYAAAALAGFAIGLGILFIMDRFDDRINSTTELRDYFNERVLGQMPYEHSLTADPKRRLVNPGDDRHTYSESFRNLRSALVFMEVEGKRPKTILFTSASPDEGKTTVAANFAITLALLDCKVLLIDADLRRGSLGRILDVETTHGFTDVLLQKANWRTAIAQTKHKNLSVMPCGKYTSQGAELFLSPVTDVFLKEIYDQFDYVIFDTSPVMAADDATSLAPKIDGTIFVLRAGLTAARAARNALDQLYQRQVNLLGLVLNSVNALLPDYYYYYRYYEYYRPKDEVKETKDAKR